MSEWTQTDRRIGTWSAAGMVTIIVLYVIVGLIGVAARPPNLNALHQIDPYLAIMEVLMIISAVTSVVMMSAVYIYAPPERRVFGLAALAFNIIFAGLTSSLHFASLTIGRQIDSAAWPLLSEQLSFDHWLTLALSLDLFAWDFLLGLSLLFAALVFRGKGLAQAVRVSMIVTGTLCLASTLGPATGNLRIQFLGIAGYAFALPVACAVLAMFFRREPLRLTNS